MTDSTNTTESTPGSQFQILNSIRGTSVQARLLSLAGQLPRDKHKANTNQNNVAPQTTSPRSQPIPSANIQQLRPKPQLSQVLEHSPYTLPQTQSLSVSHSPVTQHYSPVVQPQMTAQPQGQRHSQMPDPHESQHLPQQTSFNSVQFNAFVPLRSTSNPSTPSSLVNSPAVVATPEMTSNVQSLAGTGFQLSLNNTNNISNQPVTNALKDEDDSPQSFSPGGSPVNDLTPDNFTREDDSSLQDMSPDLPKRSKISVKDVFNQEEDDDGLGSGRKRKLVPLDYGEEARKLKRENKLQEDKKTHIKTLIDKIPTEKEALFAYDIDWEMVDNTLMEKRIRPWINKKIVEYIGEPEPTLVDFICTKVLAQSAPQSILDDVMMVLDEEAEVFVVKMWRLLVYEIEAKKFGIATKG